MHGLHRLNRIVNVFVGVSVMIMILLSIIAGQVFAPQNFTFLGIQKSALTAFLRASVKLGDRYLIKQVFKDSLVAEYPVVFDSYIQENDWITRLHEIEARSPQSTDILATMAVVYEHRGDQSQAKIYREKVQSIDPVHKY